MSTDGDPKRSTSPRADQHTQTAAPSDRDVDDRSKNTDRSKRDDHRDRTDTKQDRRLSDDRSRSKHSRDHRSRSRDRRRRRSRSRSQDRSDRRDRDRYTRGDRRRSRSRSRSRDRYRRRRSPSPPRRHRRSSRSRSRDRPTSRRRRSSYSRSRSRSRSKSIERAAIKEILNNPYTAPSTLPTGLPLGGIPPVGGAAAMAPLPNLASLMATNGGMALPPGTISPAHAMLGGTTTLPSMSMPGMGVGGLAGVGPVINTMPNMAPARLAKIQAGTALIGGGPARSNKRLYVGGLPTPCDETQLINFLNAVLVALGIVKTSQTPVTKCEINHERAFAFVEFLSMFDCTAAMALDGVMYNGHMLKVKRPKDFLRPPGVFDPPPLGAANIANMLAHSTGAVPPS